MVWTITPEVSGCTGESGWSTDVEILTGSVVMPAGFLAHPQAKASRTQTMMNALI
jgi:hypothetical protein